MKQAVAKLIHEHIKLRPAAKAQDIYKLLYQGVFGVGHIISDRAWDVLVEEAGRIGFDDHLDDPLFEPVSPDGLMVRVNLRQYINQGGDLKTLFEVMKKSAQYMGESTEFTEYWSKFKGLVIDEGLDFELDEIEALDEAIQSDGVKPKHHTETYREAYYPAYRVVRLDIYREMTMSQG